MTLDLAARVSGYLTLALAAACLARADAPFVPVLPALWLPVFAGFVAACVVEGRGWVMPVWASNLAGALIVVGVVAAVIVHLFSDFADDLPLTLALLPYVGPVVVLLALVKAFGPKQANDLWVLQGLGLLLVGLGCVLSDGGSFGALLLAYAACGTWHLALAYLRREERRAAVPGAAPAAVPWPALGLTRAARWLLAAGLLALPAFLLVPRLGDEPWSPIIFAGPTAPRPPGRSETGLADVLDLNKTGVLDPTDEVAVLVEAFADAGLTVPKTDLPPGQRWRGATLDGYANGRWQPVRVVRLGAIAVGRGPMAVGPPRDEQHELPDLGPGQFFLNFTVLPKQGGGLVLAEPAVVRGDLVPAIGTHAEAGGRMLFQAERGTIVPAVRLGDRTEVHYRQVVPVVADPELSEPVQLPPGYVIQRPLPELVSWTKDLVQRLAAQPGSGVVPDDLERVVMSEDWARPREPERLARALTAYLASSGEYAYSFEQEREEYDLDPTFDFLKNVKHGPCTRFAAGLALMLRALGVPARVVLGFRGCDDLGDGRYRILASQAHAWVEALVPRPGPDGAPQWHWLALDPTPSSDAVPRPSFSLARWWEQHKPDGLALWRNYVVDYKPGSPQSDLLGPLSEALGLNGESGTVRPGWLTGGLAAGLVACGLGVAYRVRRKRRRAAATRYAARVPFYARLLDVLARVHGLGPRLAQTPREFAAEAGRALRARDRADVADVPARLAELFYRVAFGGRPLTDDEAREVEGRLRALAAR
jgi:transglutaminase-like putative cysteine protease